MVDIQAYSVRMVAYGLKVLQCAIHRRLNHVGQTGVRQDFPVKRGMNVAVDPSGGNREPLHGGSPQVMVSSLWPWRL